MWLSAIKLAVSAGGKIYANRQRTKMAMSDAQLMHAEKMARGEEQYQGKLLEEKMKQTKKQDKKIAKTIRKFKKGKLTIGKSDKKVKNRKQAIAIALNRAGIKQKGKA